jgi:hypothetical protein
MWLAASEMPPIVCNMKGVFAFYGKLASSKQNRPMVNGTKWLYEVPKLTIRKWPPIASTFYVARAKV